MATEGIPENCREHCPISVLWAVRPDLVEGLDPNCAGFNLTSVAEPLGVGKAENPRPMTVLTCGNPAVQDFFNRLTAKLS